MMMILAGAVQGAVFGKEVMEGSIHGRVTDANTGDGVPFMTVRILNTKLHTLTDDAGRFEFQGLAGGTITLEVAGIGYNAASQTVVVPPSRSGEQSHQWREVVFRLQEQMIQLNEVNIVVEAGGIEELRPATAQPLASRLIQTIPGNRDDVARSISILPGITPMRIERNDLIVRGGAPFENLIMIDNLEFSTINHFAVQGTGTGAASVIGTEFIRQADFSSGGFGVSMGDKLSSVISLTLRDGATDRFRSSVMISATQFGLTVEGPLATGSMLLTMRRSYLEPVFKLYDMSFAPVYWDATGKWTIGSGRSDKLEILVLGARDRTVQYNDSHAHLLANNDFVFSTQDNLTGGVVWKHVGPRWFSMVTAGESWGYSTYTQSGQFNPSISRLEAERNELWGVVNANWSLTDHTVVSWGGSGKAVRVSELADLERIPWFLEHDESMTRFRVHSDTAGVKGAAYAQLGQDFGVIGMNAGVRAEYFSLLRFPLAVGPRFSAILRWPHPLEFTFSAGRYYQAPDYFWLANPANFRLRHAGADHIIGGISVRLGGVRVSLEGYQKRYFQYPVSLEVPCMTVFNSGSPGPDFKDFGLDSLVNRGRGLSQGVELLVQKEASDAVLSGTLTLSYGKTEFTALDGVTRPSDHDQRFIMNAVTEWRLQKHWGIGTRFLLYTGHPYTDPNLLVNGKVDEYMRTYNSLRVRINHSLDVRVFYLWQSTSASVEAFFDVQNVYNRKPYDTPEILVHQGIYRETGMIGIVPSAGVKVSL